MRVLVATVGVRDPLPPDGSAPMGGVRLALAGGYDRVWLLATRAGLDPYPGGTLPQADVTAKLIARETGTTPSIAVLDADNPSAFQEMLPAVGRALEAISAGLPADCEIDVCGNSGTPATLQALSIYAASGYPRALHLVDAPDPRGNPAATDWRFEVPVALLRWSGLVEAWSAALQRGSYAEATLRAGELVHAAGEAPGSVHDDARLAQGLSETALKLDALEFGQAKEALKSTRRRLQAAHPALAATLSVEPFPEESAAGRDGAWLDAIGRRIERGEFAIATTLSAALCEQVFARRLLEHHGLPQDLAASKDLRVRHIAERALAEKRRGRGAAVSAGGGRMNGTDDYQTVLEALDDPCFKELRASLAAMDPKRDTLARVVAARNSFVHAGTSVSVETAKAGNKLARACVVAFGGSTLSGSTAAAIRSATPALRRALMAAGRP